MVKFNFHTHTNYCDGSAKPQAYIDKAIELSFSAIGFSGHAPVPFSNEWSIKPEQLGNYCQEIKELKELYKNKIPIYLGLEIDFIPSITTRFELIKKQQQLDYHIGSVHFVKHPENKELWFIDGPEQGYIKGLSEIFKNEPQKAVETYYHQICEMVASEKPDVIGHFDKVKMHNKNRFFSEEESWYKRIIKETLKIISNSDSILEVNTRGIYKKKTDTLFPDISILEQCYMLKIPITLSSDAHKPEELMNYFSETIDILKCIGFKHLLMLNGNKWVKIEINKHQD